MTNPEINRRDFLKQAAAVGAGAVLAPILLGAEEKGGGEKDLAIAFIGVGTQGRVLMQNCLKIPGLKFVAVCDIWPYAQQYGTRLLIRYGHTVNGYADYQEMLASEKTLDACIIASPDWVHAEQTVACLKAGKHVYCEKEMSNSLAQAREMVVAARETKRLLQVGHQRRSNPRYHAALDFVTKKKCCGRVTHVLGQWNRARRLEAAWPKGSELDEATLKRHGYDSMHRLRNWRWYKKYSGGPIADLGSHQVDVFNWFLGAAPRAVMAGGGLDYYEGMEWYDTLDVLYEWDTVQDGRKTVARGFYQLLGNSSHGGYTETFVGDEGGLTIAELDWQGGIRREPLAPITDWEKDLQRVSIGPAQPVAPEKAGQDSTAADTTADLIITPPSRRAPGRYYAPVTVPGPAKSEHLPHLENFFDAIRKGVPLNCPAEVGYETAVSCLRANDALEAGRRLELRPDEFRA